MVILCALAGCKVDTTTTVQVNRDGSGTVTVAAVLDADAVRAVEVGGGTLEQRIRLEDLRAKGWRVSAWRRDPNGAAGIECTKAFAEAADAGAVVAEVMGPTGPLRDVAVARDQGMLRTTTDLRAVGDVPGMSLAVAADPELAEVLRAGGVDPEATDRTFSQRLRDSATFRVTARLPGVERTWTLPHDRRVPLRAESSVLDVARGVWLALAFVLVVLAAAVLFVPGRRRATELSQGTGTVPTDGQDEDDPSVH